MAAKTGGTRRAPATAKVVAGAAVSPADVQETLIPAPAVVVETPVLVEDATSTVELLTAVADAVATGAEDVDVPAAEPAVNRLAAIAALTGTPAPLAKATVVVREASPNGEVVTWADGDAELVSGVVVFDMLRAIVAGRPKQARKGTTVYAPEAVIARAVALGAVVRAD